SAALAPRAMIRPSRMAIDEVISNVELTVMILPLSKPIVPESEAEMVSEKIMERNVSWIKLCRYVRMTVRSPEWASVIFNFQGTGVV
ncbi:MAG: hypothetical protein ACKO0V_09060, partial [bacterium]